MSAQDQLKKYAIKSGHIEYELTGSTTGTKTVWWDNYGDKLFEETKSRLPQLEWLVAGSLQVPLVIVKHSYLSSRI